MYFIAHTEVTRSLSEPGAFLSEAPVCKKLTPKLVPIRPKNLPQHVGAMSWHHAKFMIFSHVLDLQELKNQVSRSFRPSHDTQMFEFYSHFLHGTYKFTQRHTCDFLANFGVLEHVLEVQIWIMHIKCPETQLMHKNAKRTRNNSKFKHDTHVLVACSLYVNVLAIQTPSFPSVTPFSLSKHNEKIR